MKHRPTGDPLSPSVIVVNAAVLRPPGGAAGRPVSAVAVTGGTISAVGTDEEVLETRGATTEVIDAQGGLLMPGFDDAHNHVLAGGVWMSRLGLQAATELRDIQRMVSEYSAAHPGDDWLVGGGWSYGMLPAPLPRREQLDAAVADRPVFLINSDGHTSWVNSVALRLAGIDRNTPDPPNGVIERDPVTGEPTGALLERATGLIHRVMPERTTVDYESDLLAAMPGLIRAGFTAVQDPRSEYEELQGWTTVRDRGDLRLRSRLALMMLPELSFAEWCTTLDEHEEVLRDFRDPDWLDGGILKCFIDGVVETGTAAMLEPYLTGSAGTGRSAFEPEQLTAFVTEADRRGWQVQMHAIGDRAVNLALNAVEGAIGANGPWSACQIRAGGSTRRRHRVEHIEVLSPADVERFARLGVVASIQPMHASSDPGRVESWVELLGEQRTAWAWPMAHILGAGGTIALGSDWPVVAFDPFATLAAAVTTSNLVGEGGTGSNALTMHQALTAYTYGGAIAAHAEDRRGSVIVGKDADLILLDRDLLREGAGVLAGTRVLATMVDGRFVHRHE